MPSQEQIDRLRALDKKGAFSVLSNDEQAYLRSIIGGKQKVKELEVPGSGGVRKEIFETSKGIDQLRGKFIPDVREKKFFGLIGPEVIKEGKPIDLSKPQESVRKFTPDVRKKTIPSRSLGGALFVPEQTVQEEGFNPLVESLKEATRETATVAARSTGIPLLLEKTGAVDNFNEKFAGLTDQEVEEIPALQKFAAALPADIAFGEVLGVGAKVAVRTPAGQAAVRKAKRLLPSTTKAGRRALSIKAYRDRQVQIASESLDEFIKAKGGISEKVAKEAIEEGFPLKSATAKELKRMLKVDKASKAAGQRGVLRAEGMTKKEAAEFLGDKFGFKPSTKKIIEPVPTINSQAVRETVVQTADDIVRTSASGTPDVSGLKVPDPTALGGAPTKKRVANFSLSTIPANEEDIVGAVQQIVDANEDVFWNGRLLGKDSLSREVAEEMFESLGLDPKDALKARELGQAWDPRVAAKLHQHIVKESENLVGLAKQLDPDNPKHLQAFTKQLTEHVANLSTFKGGVSEAARTLRFQRDPAASKKKSISKLFQAISNEKQLKKAMQFMQAIDPNDIETINKFTEGLTKPIWKKLGDAVYFNWINSILSGPVTQIRNITGNTITAVMSPVEKVGEAAVSATRTGAGKLVGKDIPRTAFFGEAPQQAIGMASGLKEGSRAFAKALRTGVSQFGGDAKFGASKVINPIPGKVGDVIGLPGRFLVAFDDLFKAINFNAAVHGGAYKQAIKEGLKGGDIATRMAQLIKNPEGVLKNEAINEALYRTFTKDLGPSGKKFQALARSMPGMKWLTPFIRTPINIAKFGVERTPLGVLQLATKTGRANVDKVVARAAGGTLLAGGVAQLYSEGSITGAAPKDPAKRRVFYQEGKLPYAVKLNGRWFQYGVEPFGITIGLIADTLGVFDAIEQDDAALALGIGMAKNLADKSFLQGLSNFFDALSEPERFGTRFAGQLASSNIPFSGLIRGVANIQDPILRKKESAGDFFKNNLPGLKESLPPIYDIWGQSVVFDGSAATKLLSPIRTSAESTDKATQEVARLQAKPGSIRRSLGKDFELTDPVYDLAQKQSGRLAKEFVDRLVNAPDWDKRADTIQADQIQKAFRDARSIVRKKLSVTQTNRVAKKLVKAIRVAQDNRDSALEQELKGRLDTIMTREVIKLKKDIK